MAQISYSQLRGWRDLCEFLDGCWYKFATLPEIAQGCPGVLPALYDPCQRSHRDRLYDNYLIQLVRWQEHPILSFRSGRRIRREFQGEWGWRLTAQWEHKIHYLEHTVLLGQEPDVKPWEPGLRSRLREREEARARRELQARLAAAKDQERRDLAAANGVCWKCAQRLAFMMVDCTTCGAMQ